MNISAEFISILVAVIGQALFVAFRLGRMEQKLEMLEKKQDKHNNLIERMTRVEDSTKSAHYRIDKLTGGQL